MSGGNEPTCRATACADEGLQFVLLVAEAAGGGWAPQRAGERQGRSPPGGGGLTAARLAFRPLDPALHCKLPILNCRNYELALTCAELLARLLAGPGNARANKPAPSTSCLGSCFSRQFCFRNCGRLGQQCRVPAGGLHIVSNGVHIAGSLAK